VNPRQAQGGPSVTGREPEALKVCWCPNITKALITNDWVQKGLGCLSEEGRRAIYAYFWDELRGAELAKALGVSEDHAKKPVSRAIKRSAQALIRLAQEPHDSSI
jgi:DNA-directed RNA polymerase specialized sigma24 family protein